MTISALTGSTFCAAVFVVIVIVTRGAVNITNIHRTLNTARRSFITLILLVDRFAMLLLNREQNGARQSGLPQGECPAHARVIPEEWWDDVAAESLAERPRRDVVAECG